MNIDFSKNKKNKKFESKLPTHKAHSIDFQII